MKKYTIVFLCVLLVTSLLVAAAGFAISEFLLKPLGIDRQEHPIAMPFVLLEDEMLQFQIRRAWEKAHAPETEPPETEIPVTTEDEAVTETTLPPETEPVYLELDESWFDDVLFIGDSRTCGLKSMGRLGKADYFCDVSMTVYSVMNVYLSDTNFYNLTLKGLLQTRTYGKIYIHLGLNEIMLGTDTVMDGYMDVIDLIREYQPDAVIVIQESLSMSEQMGKMDHLPMAEFRKLNEALRQLAESDPEVYRFCPTNDWAAGEEGYIRPEITFDGCHLYGTYNPEWAQFILEDAGWYGIE